MISEEDEMVLVRATTSLDTLANGRVPDAETQKLLQVDFPKVVGLLLSCKVHPDDAERHNDRLTDVISFLATWLNRSACPMYDEVLQILCKIFDGTKSNFYKEDGYDVGSASKRRQNSKGRSGTSFLAQNVKFFIGKDGEGLAAILRRMQDNCPLRSLTLYLRVVALTKSFVSDDTTELLMGCQKTSIARLNVSVDDSVELKWLNRAKFEAIMVALTEACDTLPSAQEEAELLRLEMVWRLLNCPVLEKQTMGLKILNDVIERVKPSKRGSKSNYIKLLSQESLLAWTKKKDVLGFLLRPNTHYELLRLTEELLAFYVDVEAITTTQIDDLWRKCLSDNGHEAGVAMELLISLTFVLSTEKLHHIADLMAAIPIAEYTVGLLSLLKDFTREALNNQVKRSKDAAEVHFFGLPVLWEAFVHQNLPRGSGEVKLVVRAQALLGELLYLSGLESQRVPYIDACIDHLKVGHEPVLTLKLIASLLTSFPKKMSPLDGWKGRRPAHQNPGISMEELIVMLDTEKGLLDLLLRDLLSAKHRDRPGLQEECFLLLDLLLSCSELVLTTEQALLLWRQLVVDVEGRAGELVARAEMWFTIAIGAQYRDMAPVAIFEDGVCATLFKEICAYSPMHFEDQHSLDTFLTLFLATNKHEGNIASFESTSAFSVISRTFLGLDCLWTVILKTRTTSVVANSIRFLIALHTQLAGDLQSEARLIKRELIEECLRKATHAFEHKDAVELARSLLVLRTFVAPIAVQLKPQGSPLEVVLCLKPKLKEEHKVMLSSTDTLAEVRAQAAAAFRHPPGALKLEIPAAGNLARDDKTPLKDLRKAFVNKRLTVYFTKLEQVQLHGRSHSIDLIQGLEPRDLLEDTEYFTLFTILGWSSPESQRACWELLQMLPECEVIANGICVQPDDDTAPWENRIPADIPAQTLFALDTLRKKVTKQAFETEVEKEERQTLLRSFHQHGGLEHLLSVLVREPEPRPTDTWSLVMQTRSVGALLNLLCLDLQATLKAAMSLPAASVICRVLEAILDATMYRCRPEDLGDLSDNEQKALAATVRHAWELLLSLLKNPKSDSAPEVKTEEGPEASSFDPQRDIFQEHGERIREIVAASLVCPIDAVRVALCDGMRNFCSGFITPVNKVSTTTRLRDEKMMSSLFLQELLRLLPYTASKTRRCAEYFQLVAELFTASFEHGHFDFSQCSLSSIEEMPGGQDPKQLNILEQLESLLQRHEPGEAHSDQTLLGLLNLIKVVVQLMATASAGAKGSRELLDRSAPRLIEEIYQCLYASAMDLTKRDKCVSIRCRDAALKTLSELSASSSKAFSTQLELTRDAHLNMPAHEHEWDLVPEVTGLLLYVGLHNLGCTCYMNSLLQQMFMTPGFGEAILNVEDVPNPTETALVPEEAQEAVSKRDMAEWTDGLQQESEETGFLDKGAEAPSLLFQLQKVFLNLTHLQAASYNPQIFVQSFKGWDGEPINVNVQMDVHEFWSMLYDRLEENLKKTSQPNLLQHTFGGVVSNQLICQGCPHRFDRQETFSHISVEIQHASNLQEGLAKFVQGEMLSGSNAYHCGTCDAKVIFMSIFITFMILQKFQLFIFVDTYKRTVLRQLPPTLVLHLKRFEFDFELMRKQKLNGRFPFPAVLDMRPYTVEGVVQADVLQQQLRRGASMRPSQGEGEATSAPNGESGGADASPLLYELVGVLVHFGQAEHGHYYSFIKEAELQDGRWFEFNDTRVVHFDAKGLEAETFGGKDEPGLNMGGSMGGPQPGSRGSRSSQQSAGAWESFTSTERDRSAYLLFYRRQNEDSTRQASQSPRNNHQSSLGHLRGVEQDIARRNLAVQRDRYYLDPSYLSFFYNTVHCAESLVPTNRFYPLSSEIISRDKLDVLCVQTCVLFAFRTAFRARDGGRWVKLWVPLLNSLLSRSLPSCVWLAGLLAQCDAFWLIQLLVLSPDSTSRDLISGLVCDSMAHLLPFELDPSIAPPQASSASVSALSPPSTPVSSPIRMTGSPIASSSPSVPPPADASPTTLDSSFHEVLRKGTRVETLHSGSSVTNLSGAGKSAVKVLDQAGIKSLQDLAHVTQDQLKSMRATVPNIEALCKAARKTLQLIMQQKQDSDFEFPRTTTFLGLQQHGIQLYVRGCVAALRQACTWGSNLPGTSRPCHWNSLLTHWCKFLSLKCEGLAALAVSEGSVEVLVELYMGESRGLVEKDPLLVLLALLIPFTPQLEKRSELLARLVEDCIEGANEAATTQVCVLLCRDDMEASQSLLDLLAQGVGQTDVPAFLPYLRILEAVLALDDSVAEQRAASGVQMVLPVMEANQTYYWATSVCITHVLKMATNNSVVQRCFASASRISWIKDWLSKNSQAPKAPSSKGGMARSQVIAGTATREFKIAGKLPGGKGGSGWKGKAIDASALLDIFEKLTATPVHV